MQAFNAIEVKFVVTVEFESSEFVESGDIKLDELKFTQVGFFDNDFFQVDQLMNVF